MDKFMKRLDFRATQMVLGLENEIVKSLWLFYEWGVGGGALVSYQGGGVEYNPVSLGIIIPNRDTFCEEGWEELMRPNAIRSSELDSKLHRVKKLTIVASYVC